jgi:hypothetical protein
VSGLEASNQGPSAAALHLDVRIPDAGCAGAPARERARGAWNESRGCRGARGVPGWSHRISKLLRNGGGAGGAIGGARTTYLATRDAGNTPGAPARRAMAKREARARHDGLGHIAARGVGLPGYRYSIRIGLASHPTI